MILVNGIYTVIDSFTRTSNSVTVRVRTLLRLPQPRQKLLLLSN